MPHAATRTTASLSLRETAANAADAETRFDFTVPLEGWQTVTGTWGIEEVPGSIWTCNEHSNLHHLGYWSDDLPADGDGLAAVGCPLQLCGRSGDQAPVSFVYQRNQLGVRIELVDATMREAMGFLFEPDLG